MTRDDRHTRSRSAAWRRRPERKELVPLPALRRRAPLLSEQEKEQIRNSPCGRCGAVPPYGYGPRGRNGERQPIRSHPHRLVPGYEGGKYERGNVVPRCPKCHVLDHKERGDTIGFIEAATLALPPERRAEVGRKGARALWDGMTGDQKRAFVARRQESIPREATLRGAKAGGLARHALSDKRKREIALKLSMAARKRWAGYSPERRAEIGKNMSAGRRSLTVVPSGTRNR